jgi:uncharacterized protein
MIRNKGKIMVDEVVFGVSPRHILVTGATGFVGKNLIESLLASHHQVTIISRSPEKAAALFKGKVRCIVSISELSNDEKIDIIINLAGARILGRRWTKKRRQVLLQSRVGLTQKIIDWIAAAQHKPRLMLSASAIGFYGVQLQGDATPLDEQASPQAIFMSQLCQDWEAAARKACQYGVDVVCMRFGLILGKEGALPMMLLPIKLGFGGRLGSGKQWHSWIHVHDVLSAMAHLINRSVNEAPSGKWLAYNFTAPEVVSQLQFSQIAAKIHRRPCVIPTPAWPMRFMLGEQADLLLEGQYVVPKQLMLDGFKFRFPHLSDALTDLR